MEKFEIITTWSFAIFLCLTSISISGIMIIIAIRDYKDDINIYNKIENLLILSFFLIGAFSIFGFGSSLLIVNILKII